MPVKEKHRTYAEIIEMFNKLCLKGEITVLDKALNVIEIDRATTKALAIAHAMGYKQTKEKSIFAEF
jgi:hypothetical protein